MKRQRFLLDTIEMAKNLKSASEPVIPACRCGVTLTVHRNNGGVVCICCTMAHGTLFDAPVSRIEQAIERGYTIND